MIRRTEPSRTVPAAIGLRPAMETGVPSGVSQESALMLTDSLRAVASSRHQRMRCSWSGSSATRPRLVRGPAGEGQAAGRWAVADGLDVAVRLQQAEEDGAGDARVRVSPPFSKRAVACRGLHGPLGIHLKVP